MFARVRTDDRGSMPIAMLVTLVAVSLGAGLTNLVTGQLRNTSAEADRVAAISAAQAGLDAGLATLRGALVVATSVVGDLSKLPCAPIGGSLPRLGNSASSAPSYTTSMAYFLVNPVGKVNALIPLGDLTRVSTLINTPGGAAGAITAALPGLVDPSKVTAAVNSAVPCVNGLLQQVPLFALLRSVGKVGNITRTLYATYNVRTTEETINGGHIVVAGSGGNLCLGARSADLSAAIAPSPMYVYAVSCTGDQDAVTFIYPKNISLSLAKTRTNGKADKPAPYGLCITSPALPVAGNPVTFTNCLPTRTATQMFSYDVNAQTYYAPNATLGNGLCLNADDMTKPVPQIVLKATCGSANVSGHSFVPDASVGAGGAGVNSGQFVNFQEVGRCLDLTNETPDGSGFAAGKPVGLITYPCKQSFTGVPYWNHKWNSPTLAIGVESITGLIFTVPDRGKWINQKWCMRSPGPTGGYVWVALCSTATTDLQWTVYGASADSSKAYRVTDVYGNCLMAAGTLGATYQYSGWSYVITAKCDGQDYQKWNAPRSLGVAPLTGIQEK
jgi:hypothetical protein